MKTDKGADAPRVTDEELAEVAKLDAEATEGPWTTDGGQIVETEHQIDRAADEGERADVCEVLHYGRDRGPFRTGTACFIARARSLLPRLAAEVTALRAEVAERDAQIARLAVEHERALNEATAEAEDARSGESISDEQSSALWHALDVLQADDPIDEEAWTEALAALDVLAIDTGPLVSLRAVVDDQQPLLDVVHDILLAAEDSAVPEHSDVPTRLIDALRKAADR